MRKTQAKKNQACIQLANITKKLADITNQDRNDLASQNTNARRPKNKLAFIQDLSLRVAIEKSAHRFTYMKMLWIPSPSQVFHLTLDPEYNAKDRFASMEKEQQGILRDLHDIIPAQWHDQINNEVVMLTVCILPTIVPLSNPQQTTSSIVK